jgi:hypothetical protein
MHEWYVFGATNITTSIRAFVAKNLDAKTVAPYIPTWVASAITTTIRAFVAKNLDTKTVAPYLPT